MQWLNTITSCTQMFCFLVHNEIRRRVRFGNACYYLVKKLTSDITATFQIAKDFICICTGLKERNCFHHLWWAKNQYRWMEMSLKLLVCVLIHSLCFFNFSTYEMVRVNNKWYHVYILYNVRDNILCVGCSVWSDWSTVVLFSCAEISSW
jgi:hypothetical protein